MWLLIQGRGGLAGRTLQAAPSPQARARALHQGRHGQGRSGGENAASLLPRTPLPTAPMWEHEELGGQEEIAAPEESAANAAEAEVAGMGSVGAAEAADSEVVPLAKMEAVVVAGLTSTVREATTVPEMVGEGTAAVTAAASDGGLAYASPLPGEHGRAGEESWTAWGDSPSLLGVAEIAGVVAEAVRRPEGPSSEEAAPTATASAGTTAVAAAASKRGRA
ncbi:unnamed protein product [Closterium sp. NIES-64]|nr:unnamed protein product [Closterium sp. NIES-64]